MDVFLTGGDSSQDVAISKDFFANGGIQNQFTLVLNATNGGGTKSDTETVKYIWQFLTQLSLFQA
jgi:hypothetical protein